MDHELFKAAKFGGPDGTPAPIITKRGKRTKPVYKSNIWQKVVMQTQEETPVKLNEQRLTSQGRFIKVEAVKKQPEPDEEGIVKPPASATANSEAL